MSNTRQHLLILTIFISLNSVFLFFLFLNVWILGVMGSTLASEWCSSSNTVAVTHNDLRIYDTHKKIQNVL